MAKYKGWRKKVVTKTVGIKVELESMDNEYWIIPKKLGVNAMQEIMQYNQVEINPEEIDADDFDKVEEKIKDEIKKMKKSGKTLANTNIIAMAKVAFLNGVHDHNFDEPVLILDEEGNPKKDEDGDYLAQEDEEGNPKMKKAEWNEALFISMSGYYEAIMEIYTTVMQFNRPAKKKKLGK